jgi:hypothetical protein
LLLLRHGNHYRNWLANCQQYWLGIFQNFQNNLFRRSLTPLPNSAKPTSATLSEPFQTIAGNLCQMLFSALKTSAS